MGRGEYWNVQTVQMLPIYPRKARQKLWGNNGKGTKPYSFPSLHPTPCPMPALPPCPFLLLTSEYPPSSFPYPWGGHVTHTLWPCDSQAPHGHRGWVRDGHVIWARWLSVRSGTGVERWGKKSPLFHEAIELGAFGAAAPVTYLSKSLVEREIETDFWKYYLNI